MQYCTLHIDHPRRWADIGWQVGKQPEEVFYSGKSYGEKVSRQVSVLL